jgi:signal transduction histidine kinase
MKTHIISLAFVVFPLLFYAQTTTTHVSISRLCVREDTCMLINNILDLTAVDDELRIYFHKNNTNDTFCYQLEKVNQRVIRDTLPMASYTNLRGGEYNFRVWLDKKGTRIDTTQFKIIIKRSLTEEEWFFPSMAFYTLLLVGAIVYFWTIYNFRQKLKIQNIRNQIAADLHDEVGSTLSSISIFAKTLERKMTKNATDGLPIIEKIMASSDETITNLRDTVWAINPDNDDMPKLLEKMRSFAYQVFAAKDIALQFENGFEAMKSIKINMEQRRNVYLMFKEAIHNIIKHADASRVFIEAKREKNGVRLTIQDNGKGFDALSWQGTKQLSGSADGNGLKNFERRAKECFIQFDLSSKIGEGTTISFLIPDI